VLLDPAAIGTDLDASAHRVVVRARADRLQLQPVAVGPDVVQQLCRPANIPEQDVELSIALKSLRSQGERFAMHRNATTTAGFGRYEIGNN
jgi:hypothetical protein